VPSTSADGDRVPVVHLADRDIRVTTLGQGLAQHGVLGQAQAGAPAGPVRSAGAGEIEARRMSSGIKQQDVLESLLEPIWASPCRTLRTVLIDERDRYLAEKIRTAPGDSASSPWWAPGHVPGIKRCWQPPGRRWNRPSRRTPPKGRQAGQDPQVAAAADAILALIGGRVLPYGGMPVPAFDMLTWWVAANGILAGIGALIWPGPSADHR
jgi:pheromone shutdown protein TraB